MSDSPPQRRLALHACCGPCLLEPYDAFASEMRVTVVYFNPNIHPSEEYERRLDVLLEHARQVSIEVVELEYDPVLWEARVAPHGDDAPSRCRECYRLRLAEVCRWASENGFDAVSTTLTVSPYQDAEAIAVEGRQAAGEAGLDFIARDFRGRYPEATRRSRELDMYRQNYCGCRFSADEAEARRRERRLSKERDSRRG